MIQKIYRLFYYWLTLTFLMVFAMIILGGLTRLTDSGLSITQWELFSGILPPLNIDTWNKYFSLYKEIPVHQVPISGNYDLLFVVFFLSSFF